MTLYSFKGQYPQKLPFRIVLSNNMTRTDPSTFTDEEITDAGYIAVEDKPTITSSQVLSWNAETISWDVRDKTEEELLEESTEASNYRRMQINTHRDDRIASGFTFQNNIFDSRPEDQKRISGAALLAFMAILNGAQENDYMWHGGQEPFAWITQTNTTVQMDAQTVVEFGKVAAEWERAHIFAARTLKDMDIVPEDYTDDIYWP